MITLGDIFRRYGPTYRATAGEHLPSSHRAAMTAIEHCRTEALGGHLYTCPACATTRYSYHSCRNRHCPTCQQDQGQAWLAKQQALLLPVSYFLVTFTLPAQLRALAREHQRGIYALLFRSSATALQQVAADPRFAQEGTRWSARDGGGVADLDPRPALPSTYPLPGASRRT